MKSIRIKKEYMDYFKDKDIDEFINEMINGVGDNVYKTIFTDMIKEYDYDDLEVSDDTFELIEKYSLINEESYDAFINRLLIYSNHKEYDGSILLKSNFIERLFEEE